jgi:antitoxin PrlF
MEVITMSSKGQLVIPRSIREEMGLQKQDKFAIAYEKDAILLKRIKQQDLEKEMLNLLDKFADKFEKAGISKTDIEKEIRSVRNA